MARSGNGSGGFGRDGIAMPVLFFVAVACAGGLGAYVTLPEIPGWYHALSRPSWTPPDFLFGLVWTVMYVLMALAASLVWRSYAHAGKERAARSRGLALWWAQIFANGIWSPLFFGSHLRGIALADILVLWLLILATILAFRAIRPAAAWMLLPYLLWVSYAAALNAAVWNLNG